MPTEAKVFEPRHCQALMRDFMLAHNRCNVWGTPGTGKTAASYILFNLLRLLGSSFFPVLVIAPKKVAVNVWGREQKKWQEFSDLRVVTLAGREDAFDRIEQLRRPADIYVINYDLVPWLADYLDSKGVVWPFKSVIADESTKLRNFRLSNGGKRAMALAKVSKHIGRWINLTGTPRPKDMMDLWGQMWFVDRGERLGRTISEYKRKYFIEDIYAHTITPLPGAEHAIAQKIKDVTITIKAEDYFDLPPIVSNTVYVQLNDKAMGKYRQMEEQMYTELAGTPVEAPNAAVATMKCLQMASGAVYGELLDGATVGRGAPLKNSDKTFFEFDDAKLEALEDLHEEADGPLLVAYHWKFDRRRIMKKFGKLVVEITDEKSIDDWNAGKIDIGLIHPGSAGHGIDLAIGGNILVFYSQWWDLEQYMQVIERIGPTRQAQHGLNRPVFLHHIVAEGTLDEAVLARRERRRTEQNSLMDLMKR